MLYTRLRRDTMFQNDVIEVWCTRVQCYLLQPMTRYADPSQLGPYLMLVTRLTWISDGNLPTEKPLFVLIENNNDISEQWICRNRAGCLRTCCPIVCPYRHDPPT